MAAKASSVIDLGMLLVTEMGRWREKKVDRPRAGDVSQYGACLVHRMRADSPSCERCCVLGTLGSFCDAASFVRLFLFSGPALASPARDDDDVVAGTAAADWPGISLGPLSELEGLDEEQRRWWRKGRETPTAAAMGATAVIEVTTGAAARRTVAGSMLGVCLRAALRKERRGRSSKGDGRAEGEGLKVSMSRSTSVGRALACKAGKRLACGRSASEKGLANRRSTLPEASLGPRGVRTDKGASADKQLGQSLRVRETPRNCWRQR
jgi:hypothetical protein